VALLAEELVEEWLNRKGYFTIRGVKVGVHEIDILGVKFDETGLVDCRHIEVQASMRPIGYISRIPKEFLKDGQFPTSAAIREDSVLKKGVKDWVDKKFHISKKTNLLEQLFPSEWQRFLVHNNVKSELELEFIAGEGIELIPLPRVIKELNESEFMVKSASGADFADLIHLAAKSVYTLLKQSCKRKVAIMKNSELELALRHII